MSKFTIISDAKKLTDYIGQTLKQYATVGERLHISVVSAIAHAAKHGDASILNTVFKALRPNDQTALKLYIRRISAVTGMALAGNPKGTPDGLPSEMVAEFINNGSIFGFKKGEFTIIAGHTSPQAKALGELCVARFIDPDGELDKMVFDRNNFAEVKTLGDTEVFDKLLKTLNEVEGGNTEKRIVNVSDATKNFLLGIKTAIETRKQQLTLGLG